MRIHLLEQNRRRLQTAKGFFAQIIMQRHLPLMK